jgi:hypothetical protein
MKLAPNMGRKTVIGTSDGGLRAETSKVKESIYIYKISQLKVINKLDKSYLIFS